MYLIAGLGNPERKYEGTRHNVGFEAVDALLDKLGGEKLNETKFNGAYTKVRYNSANGMEQIIIVKPLTYMNLSGNCIAPLANFYKIEPEHIIVFSDDINLDVGRMRIRPSGSAGGHNGLKSIISSLGSEKFARVRVGVGMKPDNMDLAAHVLSRFGQTDEKIMKEMYEEAANAALDIIDNGTEHAMNKYNPMKL
ncbi:peptidyl-tRNA hydrolase, PTH1 family [Oribacterium sp. KHPX15]|uniref:aminoacyl-tRNA hydrolase n=1 Tax=unclassified Oribacterium TaxID=2629782 RepID=UPI0004E18F16|nr:MULTISPECIES: aminoacyl-tRNA hydrolase [unclassified Oribacterium]SEA35264.1 peptidyl-tRNA hydrolase, PTH1 family [Oribacterium sp. KHPX15]